MERGNSDIAKMIIFGQTFLQILASIVRSEKIFYEKFYCSRQTNLVYYTGNSVILDWSIFQNFDKNADLNFSDRLVDS